MTLEEIFGRLQKLEKKHGFVLSLKSMHEGVREWHAQIVGPLGPFDSRMIVLGECTSLDVGSAINAALDRAELKICSK